MSAYVHTNKHIKNKEAFIEIKSLKHAEKYFY